MVCPAKAAVSWSWPTPDPAGTGGQIINAVRHRPPQLLDQDVVHPHRFGQSLGMPLPPAVLEVAHTLLLLGVRRDHQLAGRPRRLGGVVWPGGPEPRAGCQRTRDAGEDHERADLASAAGEPNVAQAE